MAIIASMVHNASVSISHFLDTIRPERSMALVSAASFSGFYDAGLAGKPSQPR